MTIEDHIRAYLLDPERRDLITVNGIEKKAGIPGGNLAKFLAGRRPLPEARVDTLVRVLQFIGFPKDGNFEALTPVAIEPIWGNTLPLFDKAPAEEPDLISELTKAEELFNALMDVAKKNPNDVPASDIIEFERTFKIDMSLAGVETEAPKGPVLPEYSSIPAHVTQADVDGWMKTFGKRRMKASLVIQIRLYLNQSCELSLSEGNGQVYADRHDKTRVYKKEASSAFFHLLGEGKLNEDKSWTFVHEGDAACYTKPVGNPVVEPKPVDEKKKP